MIDVGRPRYQFSETSLAGMRLGFVEEDCLLTVITRREDGSGYWCNSVSVDVYDCFGNKILNGVADKVLSVEGMWKKVVNFKNVGSYLIRWVSSDGDRGVNLVTVVDARIEWLMYRLRSIIDKSEKLFKDSSGYSDVDLFMFLVNGLGYFNTVPPVSKISIGALPVWLEDVVIELGQLYALEAQQLYAVDTDVSYNDQGLSLNIEHFSKLSGVYEEVARRILDNVRKVKWQMGSRPTVLSMFNPERAMNYVFTQMVVPGFPYFVWGLGMYHMATWKL